MSSKTFKSVVHGSSIQVHDNGEGVFIGLIREGSMTRGTTLGKSDAPALALAILEAAGHNASPNGSFSVAACYLRQGVKEQERATAEAEELAELEAEALELRNEFTGQTATEWAYPTTTAKEGWLAVARKAREMRAEK